VESSYVNLLLRVIKLCFKETTWNKTPMLKRICAVSDSGHLLSMRAQLHHKSVAAVAILSLLLVFCTRFMGRLQMVVSRGTLLSAASRSMS
jgi:hypothetical protein